MHHGAFHVVKEKEKENRFEKRLFSFRDALFNQLAYIVAIAISLFNIPQILSIWATRNADGVSLISWIGFSFGSLFWLMYAKYHNEKVLMITFGLSLFFHLLIVLGIVLY